MDSEQARVVHDSSEVRWQRCDRAPARRPSAFGLHGNRRWMSILTAVALATASLALVMSGSAQAANVASSSLPTFWFSNVSRMVDGSLTSYWKSIGAPTPTDWVMIDRGAISALGRIDLHMTEPGSPNDRIQQGVLERSNDGAAWTSLGSFSNSNQWTVTPPAATTARYVRARPTATQSAWLVVREFSVAAGSSTTTTTSGPTTTAPGSTTSTTAPTTTTTTAPSPTGFPIEGKFKVSGGRAVTQTLITDSAGLTHTVFHPTTLGVNPTGYKHPVILWGNGTENTDPTPNRYSATLTHLASWGNVVVAPHSGQTGYGTEMVRGLDKIQALNNAVGSIFYQKLDNTRIGSTGHSQGASGSVNAMVKSNGRVKSTAAIAFVDPFFFNPADQMPNWSLVTKPLHFFAGSSDFLCSANAQTNYFNGVAGAAAKASVKGGDHNVIQQANNKMLGYLTAWFKYTLEADAFARGAFVTTAGVAPEINRNTTIWERQAQKNLP